jgi:hypothetical protein
MDDRHSSRKAREAEMTQSDLKIIVTQKVQEVCDGLSLVMPGFGYGIRPYVGEILPLVQLDVHVTNERSKEKV